MSIEDAIFENTQAIKELTIVLRGQVDKGLDQAIAGEKATIGSKAPAAKTAPAKPTTQANAPTAGKTAPVAAAANRTVGAAKPAPVTAPSKAPATPAKSAPVAAPEGYDAVKAMTLKVSKTKGRETVMNIFGVYGIQASAQELDPAKYESYTVRCQAALDDYDYLYEEPAESAGEEEEFA